MKFTSILPLVTFVLAVSSASVVANQRLAWNPRLERGSASYRGTPLGGRSSAAAYGPAGHTGIEPIAQGARQKAASGFGGTPVSSTRPSIAAPEASVFDRIRIEEVAPNVYVVSAIDLLIALSQPDALMATVQPMLSFHTGPKYWIDSLVIEGVLTGQGFTVTAPKLIRRAGLEPGDTLRTVNGRPIDRDADFQALLRGVSKNPFHSVIRLEVERDGVTLTKTYQLG